MSLSLKRYALFILLLLAGSTAMGQALSVSSCGTIDKRNNGNGQAARAAGYFPGYGQNNAVAANVVGTKYDTVSYDPSTKTGAVNFKLSSATPLTNLPIITRVWITASGATSATVSGVKFGPPPPAVVVGQNYYVEYAF